MESYVIKSEPDGATKPDAPTGDNKPTERPAEVPEKFWKDGKVDTDTLLKSYVELEKMKSKGTPEQKPEDKLKDSNQTQDDLKVNENKPEDNTTQSYIPGVSNEDGQLFSKEILEQGKLSDDSYAKLEKAGYPKQVVDAYINGLQSELNTQTTKISEYKNLAGGEEGYKNMSAWMTANLSKEELSEYNEAVTSQKPSVINYAIKAMVDKYKAATGETPKLLSGGGNTPVVTGFRSQKEVSEAMKDPRYRTDPAYRADVMEKLKNSKI